ncbi:unnamed protein product [Heligmosomoides polygyrus]|uniref:Sushi domain-containing protein n=1 Tax=Heligmosomoides polygyrus TaxID=6339 RepID=A0A183G694_HELPZ|nr:unnamed protein product [Heligmosomoides polygyrus]
MLLAIIILAFLNAALGQEDSSCSTRLIFDRGYGPVTMLTYSRDGEYYRNGTAVKAECRLKNRETTFHYFTCKDGLWYDSDNVYDGGLPAHLSCSATPIDFIGNGTWECGTTPFVKQLFLAPVSLFCPSLRNDLNACCNQHDQCYTDQKGREKCDGIYCRCLTRVTKHSNWGCRVLYSKAYCALVKAFGGSAYEASKDYVPPEKVSPYDKVEGIEIRADRWSLILRPDTMVTDLSTRYAIVVLAPWTEAQSC